MLGENAKRFDNYTTKLNVHYKISLSLSLSLSLSPHTYTNGMLYLFVSTTIVLFLPLYCMFSLMYALCVICCCMELEHETKLEILCALE